MKSGFDGYYCVLFPRELATCSTLSHLPRCRLRLAVYTDREPLLPPRPSDNAVSKEMAAWTNCFSSSQSTFRDKCHLGNEGGGLLAKMFRQVLVDKERCRLVKKPSTLLAALLDGQEVRWGALSDLTAGLRQHQGRWNKYYTYFALWGTERINLKKNFKKWIPNKNVKLKLKQQMD